MMLMQRAHLILFILLTGCSQHLSVKQSSKQQYILTDQQKDDASIDGFIKPYRDSLERRMGEVLAVSEIALIAGSGSSTMKPEQLAMGNFMVDACMIVAQQKAKELNKPQPDISIFTWGSIRKSLPAGNLTLNNIYELMPFENEMVVLKLSGSDTRLLLNQLAKRYDPIGGATIMKGETNQLLVKGNPIDDNQFYYILASDYLSFGGDNLSMLVNAKERYFCNIKVRDAIVQYLKEINARGEKLKPNYEQRIKG